MHPAKNQARRAGVLYLVLALTAPIGLVLVPGRLIAGTDATATAERIRGAEWLLRLGIGSELFHQALQIFLVLALFRLFRAVDEHLAALLVVLGALVSVPIVFLNVVNEVAALTLVRAPEYLAGFDRRQLDGLARLFLRLHGQGIAVVSIFWGLWLFPFGFLVRRCGFIPRWIGTALLVAGAAYVAGAAVKLIVPAWILPVVPVTDILAFAELPVVLWLVIWGTREQPAQAPEAVSS